MLLRSNEVYLMLNSQLDDGLISLSRAAAAKGLKIGEDISVILPYLTKCFLAKFLDSSA